MQNSIWLPPRQSLNSWTHPGVSLQNIMQYSSPYIDSGHYESIWRLIAPYGVNAEITLPPSPTRLSWLDTLSFIFVEFDTVQLTLQPQWYEPIWRYTSYRVNAELSLIRTYPNAWHPSEETWQRRSGTWSVIINQSTVNWWESWRWTLCVEQPSALIMDFPSRCLYY